MTGSQIIQAGKPVFGLCLALSLLLARSAAAGDLYLADGSRLVGEISRLQDGVYVIETAFAGRLEIPAAQVRGVNLDDRARVTLDSGDRLVGTLRYSPESGQTLAGTLVGDVNLDGDRTVVAITGAGAGPEETAADNEEVKQLKQRVAQLEEEQERREDPWSGNISFGLNGAQGNTDRFSINGRAEARRETNGDRLMLYTEGSLQKENGVTTANEVLAGASLERDLNRDWFVYGNADFEKDKFEDLSLRAIANIGIGYFMVRQDDFKWKALAGVGYQYESFINNGNQEEGITSFGYDLDYHYNEWLELMHKLTYFPSLTSPADDYRLVSNLGAQMPIGHTENWKLRFNLRNQYDSSPRPGIKNLDTTYSLNVVYDFD